MGKPTTDPNKITGSHIGDATRMSNPKDGTAIIVNATMTLLFLLTTAVTLDVYTIRDLGRELVLWVIPTQDRIRIEIKAELKKN